MNNKELFSVENGVPTTAQEFPVMVRLEGDNSGAAREKISADGRPTYKVDGRAVTISRDGEPTIARNVFVHSIEPLTATGALFSVQLYKAVGKVWVKAFVSDDRVAYSVCVEKLVPVQIQPDNAQK